MATRAYCEHVGPELKVWSHKLHALSEKIDKIPSVDKQKLFPQIEELHMIMTELDDRLNEMTTSCSIADESPETGGEDRYPSSSAGAGAKEKETKFDYDFGG